MNSWQQIKKVSVQFMIFERQEIGLSRVHWESRSWLVLISIEDMVFMKLVIHHISFNHDIIMLFFIFTITICFIMFVFSRRKMDCHVIFICCIDCSVDSTDTPVHVYDALSLKETSFKCDHLSSWKNVVIKPCITGKGYNGLKSVSLQRQELSVISRSSSVLCLHC